MALERLYSIKCDECGTVYHYFYATPRRARASAKHNAWGRRPVVVGQRDVANWERNEVTGEWYRDGTIYTVDETINRDLCPACLEAWEQHSSEELADAWLCCSCA